MILPDLMAPAKKVKPPVTPLRLKRAAIQGKLLSLRDDSVFAESIRTGAVKHFDGCIKMIKDQAEDNRPMVERIIGAELLKEIESL